jgi:hypothetical protein
MREMYTTERGWAEIFVAVRCGREDASAGEHFVFFRKRSMQIAFFCLELFVRSKGIDRS